LPNGLNGVGRVPRSLKSEVVSLVEGLRCEKANSYQYG